MVGRGSRLAPLATPLRLDLMRLAIQEFIKRATFTPYLFTAVCFAVANHLRHCGGTDSEIDDKINDGRYYVRAKPCRKASIAVSIR
jgi:hypothetical protein